MLLLRVVGVPALGWMVAVQLGGLGVILMAAGAERGDVDPDAAIAVWAQLCPTLAWFGGALLAWRLRSRRVLLALETLGRGPGWVVLAGLGLGALAGALAAGHPGAGVVEAWQPARWTRGDGGWLGPGGAALPDVPGGVVVALVRSEAPAWGAVAVAAAAGGVGVLRALAGGAVAPLLGGAALLLAGVVGDGWAARLGSPWLAVVPPLLLTLGLAIGALPRGRR